MNPVLSSEIARLRERSLRRRARGGQPHRDATLFRATPNSDLA